MKITKSRRNNIIFFIVIAIFIIPQTRKPIQVFLQSGLALISPSIKKQGNLTKLANYDWKLKNESGTVFNFEDYKGEVVLINFWATWCPPCIAEMPSMQKLYNDYKGKVEFVFVTTDWYSDINSFLKKNNYTFKVYRPVDVYPDFFNITTIPRTFLIDKEGNVIIDESGAANWDSDTVRKTIDKLLSAFHNKQAQKN